MKNKKNKKKEVILLIILILLLIIIDYPFIDRLLQNTFENYEEGIINRVIDGDTVEVNGSKVRLLGINSPESGEKYYLEAKEFLENLALNQTVRMEKSKEDKDRYGRKLRYILIGGTNVNLKLVEEGYANYYFPSGKDRHYEDFKEAFDRIFKEKSNDLIFTGSLYLISELRNLITRGDEEVARRFKM